MGANSVGMLAAARRKITDRDDLGMISAVSVLVSRPEMRAPGRADAMTMTAAVPTGRLRDMAGTANGNNSSGEATVSLTSIAAGTIGRRGAGGGDSAYADLSFELLGFRSLLERQPW